MPDQDQTNASAADEAATQDAKLETPQSKDQEEHLGMDDIEKLLAEASGSLDKAAGKGTSSSSEPEPFNLGNLEPEENDGQRQSIDLLGEVELDLRIELGRTQMKLEEVLQLRGGSVVALDKLAGDPVDIFVNGKLIARGEVLVMNDNFCVRVTELVNG
ncbi:flagellar motor switch protein FliN [Novipirellula artificiosorum]|uniref:Flagellar motor switch protein FliN n=1 Tax=Novipirellula artificiosorum TaxID=2528016 RepID=A0A5C6D9J9_9BACT|nr:flagellar motor switch protein FliN [Novipirellula artificiosorum]TWU31539.1 Flagellar motor switch protein FliN [Novipirellula artificiosorum]